LRPAGDSAARRLESLWDRGEQPDPHAFLAAAGVSSPGEVAAALAVDQWRRWHAGQRVPADDYLARHPAVAADPACALMLVYGEYLVREDLGEAPSREEYVARFPQYAAPLLAQFGFHAAVAGPSTRLTAADGPSAVTLPARPAPAAALPEVPGYRILGELGRGGMGVVYKARQEALGRVVALKMISAGPGARAELLERFRTEATVVARLQHPSIVQIYEVGEAGGRPYCALEFVDGGGLNEHLAGTPQPPRAAAALVETLARAVSAAHQRGVVHRDLKPANILLSFGGRPQGAEDPPPRGRPLNEAVPKVTDFGLAKLLPGESGTPAPDEQTQSGAILGTPSYMAPEQARGRSKEVGPAADVYALGAVLYECLTGRPPFKADSSWETLRQVIHEEPVPPARLQPRLPRDVETICLKCLQKEPRRRYESAAALADDLRRFIAGRPIQARPVGAAGRLWRWARREPVVAGLLAALLPALTGVSLLWRRAEANYAESRRQYGRAEESSRDARRAVEELGEVGQERLKDVPEMEPVRRTLLEKAAAFYDKFLGERGDDPAVREEAARAYGRLGQINEQLGRRGESQAAYEKALALHTALADEAPGEPRYRHLMAADLAKGLAVLHGNGNRFAEAEAPLLKARAILEPLAAGHADRAEYQADLADCYDNLGHVWQQTGRPDQAEEAYGLSLKIRQRLARERPEDQQYQDKLAASHNNLAVLYERTKRADRAEGEYEEALAIRDRLLRAHPNVSEYRRAVGLCHSNMGWLYLTYLNQFSKAEASLRQAREVHERLAREHPSFLGYQADLSDIYRRSGLVCVRLGRPDEAEGFALKALEILERYPSDVPKYRWHLTNNYQHLAWYYHTMGKNDKAEALYDKALAECNALVARYPDVTNYRRTLGYIHPGRSKVYLAQGRTADAEAALEEGIRVREKLARDSGGEPEALSNLAWSYNDLGRLYEQTGRRELAEPLLEKALAMREPLARENPRVPVYAAGLAESYESRAGWLRDGGQAAESLDWYRRAIDLLDGVLKEDPRNADARDALSTACWGRAVALGERLQRPKEALPDWERARATDGGTNWDTLWAGQALALARLGDHARAAGDMSALEAKAATEHKTIKDDTYNVMACAYALWAKAAAGDANLPAADRARLGAEHAARAVQLLRRLHEKGYFKDPKDVEHLRESSELEVLLQRDDFRQLLREMEQTLKPGNG
jgi:tetratricopeptide (TPR) repeat protein